MRDSVDKQALGEAGENIAQAALRDSGYRIHDRNYRTRYGEIDIVAEQGGDIVFVEVKLRRTAAFGTPGEAVTVRKQQRIIKAALQYLKERRLAGRGMRFDVVAIGGGRIEIIRDAFQNTTAHF